MFRPQYFLLTVILCFSVHAFAATQVNIVGLFNNKALLMINGNGPFSIQSGQVKRGVKLVAANSEQATLVIDGKRRVLGMGQTVSIAGNAKPSGNEVNRPLHLYADSRGHFFGDLTINGASLKYLVDSGATTVAMNSADARFARIDYKKGRKGRAKTANGIVDVYLVRLTTLKIGSIVLHNVEASVIEGDSPDVLLLGMSAQNRLHMERKGPVLTLTKKY